MRNFIFSFLALILLPAYMSGQVIKGQVLDSKGMAIPSAIIVATDSKTSTDTDFDGNFNINAKVGEVLKISMVGFDAISIKATVNSMRIILSESKDTELKEVVVIGYGTQKKSDITGSIAVVSQKDLSDRPNASAVSSLQGKVAGVSIINSGSPGGQPSISIRGIGSISGRDVLYVVDGVITNDISYLNPNDIDKMSVLKDASSSAIYGIRAANGVIVITTKLGKKGVAENIKFNYDSNIGFQTPTNVPQYANASDYVALYNEKLTFEGNSDPTKVLTLAQFNGANTNWMDEVLKKSSFTNSHNIAMNGASEKAKYAMGLGYFTQDGIMNAGKGVSSGEDYKRITARFNGTYDVSDRFRIGGSLAYLKSDSNDANAPFQVARITPSVIPVYNTDGSYGTAPVSAGLGTAGNNNPRMMLDIFRGKSKTTRSLLSGFAEYDFFKDLTYKVNFSRDFETSSSYGYTPEFTPIGSAILSHSKLIENNGSRDNVLAENTLVWTKSFDKHRIVVLGGASRESRKTRNSSFSVIDVPFNGSDETLYLNLGTSLTNLLQNNAGAQGSETRFQSYFGRLQYAYDDKYLINATVRRDGASVYNFDGNQKSATFPSLGLGWVISKENFMKNSGLDFLKIKGSWGKLGNATITRQFDNTASNQAGAFFGNPSAVNTAISITQLVDPSIEWEVVTGTDLGFELRTFDNRLSVEGGYYIKETKDAIFNITNLPTSGLGGSYYTNAGSFENKGVEFSATWNDKIGEKFTYSVYGNFTTIKNEITSVIGGSFFNTGPSLFGNQIKRYENGQELGAYYGFQTDGVIQTQAEATALGSKVGAFKFKDLDENGVIDNEDKTFLGSPIPDVTYGFGINLAYSKIDFAVEFQGVAGNEIYNFNRNSRFGNENWDQDFVNNRWTTTNPTNSYPAANSDQTSSRPSSFYVEKGDYFRIRTIQLGYAIPENLLNKIKIQKLRFYLSAQNPFTAFKYNGFSPELGSQSIENLGVDNNAYPLSAIYSFGINLNF
jgi:TonB-linked SusC/RagA family outer membrane protein